MRIAPSENYAGHCLCKKIRKWFPKSSNLDIYRESGWSVKLYQEHRQEIEDHKNAQAVYSSHDGKMPTLKELTAEYDSLKERKENDQAALDKLKPKLTDLKHIRYNYEILERDSAPNSHQHVIPKDHHCDEHAVHHDDESR